MAARGVSPPAAQGLHRLRVPLPHTARAIVAGIAGQTACRLPACRVVQKDEVGGIGWDAAAVAPRASNAALIRARMHVAEQITEAILGSTDDAGIKELTKQLIESDPETQETLKRYQEAMARVERYSRGCHVLAGCWVCACSACGMMCVSAHAIMHCLLKAQSASLTMPQQNMLLAPGTS